MPSANIQFGDLAREVRVPSCVPELRECHRFCVAGEEESEGREVERSLLSLAVLALADGRVLAGR